MARNALSVPEGWDCKSWSDACAAVDDLQTLVNRLRVELESTDGSAKRLKAAFERVEAAAAFGVSAASWAE